MIELRHTFSPQPTPEMENFAGDFIGEIAG
jgi:hypothetical protein